MRKIYLPDSTLPYSTAIFSSERGKLNQSAIHAFLHTINKSFFKRSLNILLLTAFSIVGINSTVKAQTENPGNLTPTVISNTQINLTSLFNQNNDNIVVIYNLTGVFTAPIPGTDPAATGIGTTLAGSGGIIVGYGFTTFFSHTGLTANTQYFYKAFSYDINNIYSPGITASATTTGATTCPSTFITSGGGAYCSGGIGVTITLSGSETGVNYQLKNGGTPIGSPVSGTGSPLNFNNITGAGTYTIEATNSNASCTVTMNGNAVVIVNTLPSTPTITAGSSTTFCAGGSVTLTSSAGTTYLWSTGATTASISPTTSGSYTVQVTNAAGCQSAASAATVVTVNALPATPTITAGGPTTFCAGGSITLTSSAGTSYLWSTGATTSSISPTTSGSYTVQVTNAAGCQSAASAATVVTVNALPATPTITAGGPTTFCAGGSVTLTSSAGSTYLWSTGTTTSSISATTAGSYTVKVTNAAGCQSASSSATVVTVNALPATPTITAGGPTTFCAGGSVTLTSSAGTTYLWSTGTTTASISATTAGSYTVQVTNAAGCQSVASAVTVTVNALPAITTQPTTPAATCPGSGTQTISVTATGAGLTYSWRKGGVAVTNGGVISGQGTNTLTLTSPTATAAGSYDVVVSGTCTPGVTSTAVTVTVNALPAITTQPTTPAATCSGSGTQTISVTATGAGLTYSWRKGGVAVTNGGVISGQGTNTLTLTSPTATAAGSYDVVVSGTCTPGVTSTAVTVTVNALPSITIPAAAASVCFNSVAQNTTLTYSGATNSPTTYSITWNATPTNSFTNVSNAVLPAGTITIAVPAGTAPGTYTGTITVRNASGCISNGTNFTVTVNSLPLNTILPGTQTICSGDNITAIVLSNSNGVTGTTYTWNRNSPAGISGTVATSGTNVADGTAINGTFINSNSSATTVTFTLTSTSPAGCAGAAVNATVIVNPPVVITTQPLNKSVCAGASVNFTVAATGLSLTYQWRKGTTNITNGGSISGATTATLTINPTSTGDNAPDYNCVVSSGSCVSAISNYVSLTATNSATTPTAQPTAIVFPTVGTTSIIGSFTLSASSTNYLVIRTATNTQPTNPVNGTTYVVGNNALGGYVEYTGTSNVFTSNGLSPNTTYYYWVYSNNVSSCGTSPLYLVSSPLTGNVTTATTVACGTLTTLYWGGSGSVLTGSITSGTDFNTAANWSTSSPAYTASPVVPSQCNNVSISLKNSATIKLSANASVYNLSYTLVAANKTAILSVEGKTLTVNGNAVVDVTAGSNSQLLIGENSSGSGIVDFKANARIGETYYANNLPITALVGNLNSKITFRGDLLLGRTAGFFSGTGNGGTPGTVEFDGAGLQQILWNNDAYYDNFYNVVIGNQNSPYVRHVTGTYTPDNILNNLTINNGATVDLALSQWIRDAQGGTFAMNGTAKMILSNDKSIKSPGSGRGVVVPGSNFPGGFSTLSISPTSTIEYNAGSSLTQTVYGTPSVGSLTYGNLILSNGPGTGIANKISTSTITVAGNTNINAATTVTLGAGVVTSGAASVNSGATLLCGSNVVSGTGSFTLQTAGTLGIGLAAGITSSGATGNVQTSARTFGTSSNYIYNGTVAQGSGNGLPYLVNDLTVLNTLGITMNPASRNYTIGGTLILTSGALNINGDTITVNKLQRNSGTFSGSSTSSVGITGTSIPLFFTGGSQLLKNLFLTANASADLQTSLDISASSGSGTLSVASGATLNTYDNLTLKSDISGTSQVNQIPEDGSGNALGFVNGKVTVQRYYPSLRAWRLITSPLSNTGSIYNSWQNGGNYIPGIGTLVTGAVTGNATNGLDNGPLLNPSLKTGSNLANVADTKNTLLSNNTTSAANKGYLMFVRGDRNPINTNVPNTNTTTLSSKGSLQTGKQTFTVSSGTGAYSLVGNPYASPIDLNKLTLNNLVKRFYVWDPKLSSVGGYVIVEDILGTGIFTFTPNTSPGNPTQYIQSSEAFFVQTSNLGTTPSVVFSESGKSSAATNNLSMFRPMSPNQMQSLRTNLYLLNDNGTTHLADGNLAEFDSSYHMGVDMQDALKFSNANETIGLLVGSTSLAVDRRPTLSKNDTLLYKFTKNNQRKYQFEFTAQLLDQDNLAGFVEDRYLNKLSPLKMTGITRLNFEITAAAAAAAADRFRIVFKSSVVYTNLTATALNSDISVEWNMPNEFDIKAYDVERSTDGINFIKMGTVASAGNSANPVAYNWLDVAPALGEYYYRIRSISNNDVVGHSNVVKVKLNKSTPAMYVFPNPVTQNVIQLQMNGLPQGIYMVRLINDLGQAIQTNSINHTAGTATETIKPAGKLTTGTYYLQVVAPDKKTTIIKVIVE